LGEILIEVEAHDLNNLENETGGCRIQRVPPTERKGRVHTSTVTVAVIDPTVVKFNIQDSDLRIEWYSGTGAGGQNRNKVKNSCRITHIPTGVITTAQTRDRTTSLKLAKQEIIKRVSEAQASVVLSKTAQIRKEQVGSGMRGDKSKTIRFQDNTVVDHFTGKRMQADKFMRGFMDALWE